MMNRFCCNLPQPLPPTNRLRGWLAVWAVCCIVICARPASAGEAPQWMHALLASPVPHYEEKTDAVVLYSQTDLTVLSVDKIRIHVREAYKILRPSGRGRGTVSIYVNPSRKILSFRGWCIPAQGKDFELKDKDAVEVSLSDVEGSELISDVRDRVLRIPAPDPGNVVGYEYEIEERPFVLQDVWFFQGTDPVRESHYSLHLPAGWELKVSWLNHVEVPREPGNGTDWQWTVRDVEAIRKESYMPPLSGVAGQMVVSYFPSSGTPFRNVLANWQDMGSWYASLLAGRLDASPELKREVQTLTISKPSPLEKMQAIAQFVQHDIRYVAIELGIGGWQPHPAGDVFAHRFGDCKDKATLMRSMLHELGLESYHVLINTDRGSITREAPASLQFNHAIIAIPLPDGLSDPSLVAVISHPKLGRVLFFDPTDHLTPFGQIRGALQANYGLLVTANGGELVELPQQPAAMNSIRRTAEFTVDASGRLKGDVKEIRLGDRAWSERWRLLETTNAVDRVKPIESLLAGSLSSFRITHASVVNLHYADQPFGFDYSFEAENYAKSAGTLLLVRPRVVGTKSLSFLETNERRRFPIEFEGPVQDTDTFAIAIPEGYAVDDMPAPVDVDYSFASYHSKTDVSGGVIRYSRTFEIKEVSVAASRSPELRKLFSTIAADERSTVVLKATK